MQLVYIKSIAWSSQRDERFQPHMERSGMWGYKDDADKGVLKER
ncbi:hypothetical protein Barb4_04183 [Bacteroidales bacterium Barb4]|nr:hypothetical protein Barb4_04183 [Bacteroidales bacterium Barb4]